MAVNSPTTARIIKALGIFGGVKVLTILCSILRNKLVALWVGPIGVGLITLFNSTMDLISTSTQLNLPQSAVREISQAGKDNPAGKPMLITVTHRLSLILGLAGALLTCLLAPLLSEWTFGDSSHTVDFYLLSVMPLLSALAAGEWAILQATDKLQKLARCNLYAALTASAFAIAAFYFFRIAAVIPVLLSFSTANYVYARLASERGKKTPDLTFKETFRQGKGMLSLGILMTVSMAASLAASYIFVAWLNRTESAATVGAYQAGYTLMNSYVGLIFSAISMEYFPRISAFCKYPRRQEVMVSHEMKIALLLLLPVTVIFVCCREIIVDMLYSADFRSITPYLGIGICGVAFRAASWCLAYTIVARGDGKIYIFTESSSAALYLIFNIFFYTRYSFAGLGIAYICWFGAYFAICYAVYRLRYKMNLSPTSALLMLVTPLTGIGCLLLTTVIGNWWTLALALPPATWIAYRKITD